MTRRVLLGYVFIVVAFLFSSCRGKSDTTNVLADSLNSLSYSMRYKNLEEANRFATEAYRVSGGNERSKVEALNNMGFCAFMQMDFERSSRLFKKALAEGHNEIEHLISDVGLMKIYQRTSMNKLFYDCRNKAQKRMERIKEDVDLITDIHEKARFHYAVSEFYIVSGIYFYYLQQHEESIASIDAVSEEIVTKDTAQWLYYEYMRGSGGMYQAENYRKVIEGELSYLVDCLMKSHGYGYVYFEANALQAIAEMLNVPLNRSILEEDPKGLLRLVNEHNLPLDSLPLHYANKALRLFKQYGDWYQISGTYRTIATYYNYSGNPQEALKNMKMALRYVNLHHEKYYHCNDSVDRLYTYVPHTSVSTELKWITSGNIRTVPEWILRLREQLSRTYAAMGCKQESDYNRNIYLDLLDYTRQDKSLESRYVQLEKESKQLNLLLLLVTCSFVIFVVLFMIFNRYWRKKNTLYADRVKHVFALCRKIMAAIPNQVTTEENMAEIIVNTVRDDFRQIFEAESLRIVWGDDMVMDNHDETFSLVLPGTDKTIAHLQLTLKRPLQKDERSLLRLLLPYLAWSLGNGQNWVSLEDEKNHVEKEHYVHSLHLSENKRQNVLKKSCVSVVTGIFPYIDRIINEVGKLSAESLEYNPEAKKNRIEYINELITKINEYNEVLSLWIKMRRGALNLTIENFSLNELFEIVAKGKHSFEMKHLDFSVSETTAVVKADKALTLFMINTLTENARKYTSAGGSVYLATNEGDNYVEISVTDNGTGLSEKDVNRILNEKIYDSGSIGMETAQDVTELQQKKGFGFGLMNCKGIIDKYRKTSALFSVCEFNIQSTLGKGSRFSFRLPKGMGKSLSVWGFFFILLSALGGCSAAHHSNAQSASQTVSPYDSLLAIANSYANKVYDSNVKGDYTQALSYADTVLNYMNLHYSRYSGQNEPLLKLFDETTDEAGEQRWLDQGFDTDYYILLDVRNEAAVAGLALKDFQLYNYNNIAYVSLYKQISKDRSLETYCTQMQQSFNNKMIALGLFFLLILAGSVAYYILYVRRIQRYRYNMDQVFEINKAIFSVTNQASDGNDDTFGQNLSTKLYPELNELIPISNLALGIYDESTKKLNYSFYSGEEDRDALYLRMQQCFDLQKTLEYPNDAWTYFFLSVCVDGRYPVGVVALRKDLWKNREEDRLLLNWVMDYLSIIIYNVVIRVHQKYTDIELAQDETRRVLFEENALHVQNMVLDNCLSTLKHETIYYPNRIKVIIDSLISKNGNLSAQEEAEKLETVKELVTYYKSIFTMLTSCALRQLEGKTFRRENVLVAKLMDEASKYFQKKTKKLPYTLSLRTVELGMNTNMAVIGDRVLLSFLIENLIDESIRYAQGGELQLMCREDNDFVRFDFVDMRRNYTQEELNEMFYPDLKWMKKNNLDILETEFLVCKQIIREHDEHAGRRGCKINASVYEGGGVIIWFTVPKAMIPKAI